MKTRIIAELVDGCNLRCVLCWNSNRTGTGKQMSLETVAKIFTRYDDARCEISFFNWGEPLLHKDIEAVSEMAKESTAETVMSSNMSLSISDERLKALSGFSNVNVSQSGMTAEIYNIYHINGDLSLVMENLKRLSRLKLKNVTIRWLRHKYNEFQLPSAAELANRLGFRFATSQLNCCVEDLVDGFDSELLRVPKFPSKSHFCHIRYWDSINTDGAYLLCCASHNVKIGYSVDDKVSSRTLREARSATPLCTSCTEKEYWRMY